MAKSMGTDMRNTEGKRLTRRVQQRRGDAVLAGLLRAVDADEKRSDGWKTFETSAPKSGVLTNPRNDADRRIREDNAAQRRRDRK
jgi:hypothetical protein